MTPAPTLSAGTVVRVRDLWPERDGPVHIRTPHYIRGRPGRIVRCLGTFANPEDLAFARPAAKVPLYHVAFDASDLWHEPDRAHDILVEVFEHWLEPSQ